MKDYDKYIVAFSGGKDSVACFLHLLDLDIPVEKIELWHHDIDGEEEIFMDWECTKDYCRKFAEAFGIPIYFSWKEGGFKRELLRDQQLTAPICFETESKEVVKVGGERGKLNTRRKFPQLAADLKTRWCSAYLKIDVGSCAIRNQDRFDGIRTVVISGERGEESKARSKYAILEPDRSDLRNGKVKRYVDRWRPVRDWTEKQIWEIIERNLIRVHPAYYLGWGRVSCKFCIFGSANMFKTACHISPKQGEEIIALEKDFKHTIKRSESLPEFIKKGTIFENLDPEVVKQALSVIYTQSIIMDKWILPAGAYGESCGSI